MNFGWMFDGLDSSTAGFSVLDSFTCAPSEVIDKSYASEALKFARFIDVFVTPSTGTVEYMLHDYPSITATLAGGEASVTGVGGSATFLVVVFIR